jgi:hypothetical protein
MMRWLLARLRRFLGLHAYTPPAPPEYEPMAFPPAKVRKPTWHGARGNGHAPGLEVFPNPVIEALTRKHRIIRQMLADAARRCSWGQRD